MNKYVENCVNQGMTSQFQGTLAGCTIINLGELDRSLCGTSFKRLGILPLIQYLLIFRIAQFLIGRAVLCSSVY